MNQRMYGANTDELRRIADRFTRAAERAESALGTASANVMQVEWHGSDADAYRGAWAQFALEVSAKLISTLRVHATLLEQQAAEQDEASAADGVAGGGEARSRTDGDDDFLHPRPGDPGFVGPLPPLEPLQELSLAATALEAQAAGWPPEDVLAWWESLSAAERAFLFRDYPSVIGNLNGIPFRDRAVANQYAAQQVVNDPALSAQYSPAELAVVEQVASGDIVAVVFDGTDIIQMLGNPGEHVENVIIYNPGTYGSMQDLLDPEAGGILYDLYEGNADSTLAFVNLSGDWADDVAFSDYPAEDPSVAHAAGALLADFQDAIDMESLPAGVDYTTIGHSFGNSVTTASEMAGAHYDTVISLAGSNMPPGWEPNPGTNYFNVQYDNDVLDIAQNLGRPYGTAPDDHPDFDQAVFPAPPGQDYNGSPFINPPIHPVASHNLVDDGRGDGVGGGNDVVVDFVDDQIYG